MKRHEQLRARRRARNLTLAALARLLGVSAATVCLWERGTRKPSADSAARWVKALR